LNEALNFGSIWRSLAQVCGGRFSLFRSRRLPDHARSPDLNFDGRIVFDVFLADRGALNALPKRHALSDNFSLGMARPSRSF
jgi:hypothetical protein